MTQEDWNEWEAAMLSCKRKLPNNLADGLGGFCTLGVLVDIHATRENIPIEYDIPHFVRYGGTLYLLPGKLQRKFSTTGEGPPIRLRNLSESQRQLVADNRHTTLVKGSAGIFELNPYISFKEMCDILRKEITIVNNYKERLPVCK